MNQSTKNDAEFLWNDSMYALDINHHRLQLRCLRSGKLIPLSSRDIAIQLHRVIATSCGSSMRRVNAEGRPVLGNNFLDFLQFRSTRCFILTIHYWDKIQDGRRKLRTVDLRTNEENDCEEWRTVIEDRACDAWKENGLLRPRSLLVFVNPHGGKKQGVKIHQKLVSPLFKLAGIEETVVFTKHGGEAKEYLKSTDLSPYDGVVAMGGDGTFSEVANGVLEATQRKHGVALDRKGESFKEEIPFERPSIKLGVIPTGTGNVLSFSTMGVTDPETATLQIIAGESHPLDVCAMHNEQGKFVSFFCLGSTHGVTGNILQLSEKYRMIRPLRYEFAAIDAIARLASSSCEIIYLPGSNKSMEELRKDRSRCRNPCRTCLDAGNPARMRKQSSEQRESLEANSASHRNAPTSHVEEERAVREAPSEVILKAAPSSGQSARDKLKGSSSDDVISNGTSWQTIRLPYVAISALNTVCKYTDNPRGFAPSAHLADGTCDLKIYKTRSRMEFLRIYRAEYSEQGTNDNPSVEFLRVRAFHFRGLQDHEERLDASQLPNNDDKSRGGIDKDVWTIDGEIVKNATGNVTIWVHRGLINVFARGIEEA